MSFALLAFSMICYYFFSMYILYFQYFYKIIKFYTTSFWYIQDVRSFFRRYALLPELYCHLSVDSSTSESTRR